MSRNFGRENFVNAGKSLKSRRGERGLSRETSISRTDFYHKNRPGPEGKFGGAIDIKG